MEIIDGVNSLTPILMSNKKYISGIGGFFFRSKDPKATKDWYINTLGINIEEYVWNQEA